jgi:predicted DNA-binding transcriptional regulator AlpA
MPSNAPRTIITTREFRRRMGNPSRTTIWRLRKTDPSYPHTIEISPGLHGHFEDQAQDYIERRPRVAPRRVARQQQQSPERQG